MSTTPDPSASPMARAGHIAELLTRTAADVPEKLAWRQGEQELTYAELLDLAQRTAGHLRSMGVGPGDRVALLVPNTLVFPAVFYGTAWLGAVVVPLNPLSTARELEYYLTDSGASLLWTLPGMDAGAQAAAAVGIPLVTTAPDAITAFVADVAPVLEAPRGEGDDAAVVIYTSGTTGRPKGAQLTHTNVRANAIATVESMTRVRREDTLFAVMPFFHVFGLSVVLNSAIYMGAMMSVTSRFAPQEALDQIVRDRVTVIPGVPTIHGALVSAVRARRAKGQALDVSAVRFLISGGASLPVETLRTAEETWGVPLREGFGISEGSGAVSFNPIDRPGRPGTVGLPMDGVEFRLVTSEGVEVPEGDTETAGELRMRGDVIMSGYLGLPEATAAAFDDDGWLRTGDLARRDEDGYYLVVDRLKDVIIRGGYNVYPREVEEVLYEHPAVAEAAVVGMPDERFGEEVVAYVSLEAGTSVEDGELLEFVRERIAAYKCPQSVTVMDGLPKNTTGKIMKHPLR
ncbi:long-chain fatty acid--CoA ligase [Micrococcus sp. M4NT]|uniref:long-chain-fatty-acid--CoA ligase n=1 Tax=Micrococcus sp. M4NT TaxID=2957501 RepID=UPI0029BE06D4|nr:long-chain fatty acid--CoA ligase [Micrococcus sp. M4NT]MDX2340543.1 long-chain fatty acid--CoA ligase [Micrococcus sp. M4NT]